MSQADGPNTQCGHAWPDGAHAWIKEWFSRHTSAPTGAAAHGARKASLRALVPGPA